MSETAWLKLGDATGQRSQAQQQFYNRTIEKEIKSKVQISASLKRCGGALRQMCIDQCSQTSMNWSNIEQKSGPKYFHNDVKDW